MSIVKDFFKKHRKITYLLFMVLISVFLMLISNKKGPMTIRQIGESILYPFQFAGNGVVSFFTGTISSIAELRRIKTELEMTKAEIEQYKKVMLDFNELMNQNNELKKQLDLKQSIIYNSLSAEIVARDPKRLYDIFIVNKGSVNGVKENMPVIANYAGKRVLVGKIIETTPFASKILTVHHSDFNAGAYMSRSNIHCLIQGYNEIPGMIKALYIPKNYNPADITDDYIYTTGDSLVFPRGIEIGKLLKLKPSNRYDVFNEGLVQLSVDLAKLDYVLILLIQPDQDNFQLLGEP
jgi:rod shape-determining protein MreC